MRFQIASGFIGLSVLALSSAVNAMPIPTGADATFVGPAAVIGDNFNAAASVTILPNGATSGAGAVSMTGDSVSAASGQVLTSENYDKDTTRVFGSGAQVNTEKGIDLVQLGPDEIVVEGDDDI